MSIKVLEAAIRLDSDGRILSWTSQAEKMFGHQSSAVKGQKVSVLLAPPITSEIEKELEEFFRDPGEVRTWEARAARKKGPSFPVELSVTAVDGQESYLAILRNISPRKTFEEEYRREKELNELLGAIAVAANESSGIKEAMQISIDRICAYTKWPVGHAYLRAEDGSGEMVSVKIWHIDDFERFSFFRDITEKTRFSAGRGIVGRVMEEEKPVWIRDVRMDSHFIRAKIAKDIGVRSGYAFPVLVRGQVLAVLEFFSTECQEPDDLLLEVMTRMGAQLGRVVERQRAEQELIKARETALEASEAKSRFVANISHEIRTPLNAILAMTGFMRDTPLSSEQKDFIETMRQAGKSLLDLVDEVLDFSKIESGIIEAENVGFDIRALVKESIEIFSFQASEKGISLLLDFSPEVPEIIQGDPGRLRQVIANLVGNAVKFTARGSVRVVARLEPSPRNGEDLRVQVIDSGIGISPEAQDKLFKPFSQADSSTTRRYGGTGLGLSISKSLVQMMGGQIGFESAEGTGSEFWLTIPMSHGRSRPDPVVELPTEGSPRAKRAARILVAEDNRFNQKVIVKMLEKLGYEVDSVANGMDAVGAIALFPYDLILMDCQMPEMDGYEATRMIRRLRRPGASGVPIIALTASVVKGEREKCLETGMNDYLSKPVDIRGLGRMLETYLASDSDHPPGSASGAAKGDSSGKAAWSLNVLNSEALRKLKGLQEEGGPDVLEEFISLFFSLYPERAAKLRAAIESHDLRALSLEAHSLKSTCANLGAETMAALCRHLEDAGAAGEVKRAGDLLTRLESEFVRVRHRLELQLDALGSLKNN